MIDLGDLTPRAAATKVLCVGDVLIEECFYGRVRSEAAVPLFSTTGTEISVRGAAAIAGIAAHVGARCSLVAPVGEDWAGAAIRKIVGPAIALGLVGDPTRSTIRMTQFVTERTSVLLRAELGRTTPLDGRLEERLIARVMGEILDADIVVLADRESGALSDRLVRDTIAAARQQGIPTIVTSTGVDFGRYAGATILAPLFDGLCLAAGRVPADLPDLEHVCLRALEASSLEALLVLEPGRGLSFIPRASAPTHLSGPAAAVSSARCSDIGLAAFAVALACGCSWKEAMSICHGAHAVGEHNPLPGYGGTFWKDEPAAGFV